MSDERQVFPTSKDAKAAGWHSRRNQTREAQDAARVEYAENRGRAARQRRALERLEAEETA